MRKCEDCGTTKNLTKHSEIGNHQPPFILLCWACHNLRHETPQKRFKRTQRGTNGKYQKGTRHKK